MKSLNRLILAGPLECKRRTKSFIKLERDKMNFVYVIIQTLSLSIETLTKKDLIKKITITMIRLLWVQSNLCPVCLLKPFYFSNITSEEKKV